MEMLTEDSTEAESVVPGGSQEAADSVDVSVCIVITRDFGETFQSTNTFTKLQTTTIHLSDNLSLWETVFD